MKIEFLYFSDCPHHEKTFELLTSTLKDHGLDVKISRIEVKSDDEAVRLKFIGSPTIRVNERDIESVEQNRLYARTCRVYIVDGRFTGMPTRSMIEKALGVPPT